MYSMIKLSTRLQFCNNYYYPLPQTVEMMIDHCVLPGLSEGAWNTSSQAPPPVDLNCRELVQSSDLQGPLDTGGAPLQLGHKTTNEDDPEGDFAGCIKDLRINDEVGLT